MTQILQGFDLVEVTHIKFMINYKVLKFLLMKVVWSRPLEGEHHHFKRR